MGRSSACGMRPSSASSARRCRIEPYWIKTAPLLGTGAGLGLFEARPARVLARSLADQRNLQNRNGAPEAAALHLTLRLITFYGTARTASSGFARADWMFSASLSMSF